MLKYMCEYVDVYIYIWAHAHTYKDIYKQTFNNKGFYT